MSNPDELKGIEPKGDESETERVRGIGAGDIIIVGGQPRRVIGFTAPEGNPGRALMSKELSEDELRSHQMREDVIMGMIKQQIRANPDGIVVVDGARKYWGRLYDEGLKTGRTMDMQIDEIYAKRAEVTAQNARENMLIAEGQLKFAKDEAERQVILATIERERAIAVEMDAEAQGRREYSAEKVQHRE